MIMRRSDPASGSAKNELFAMFFHTLNVGNQIKQPMLSEVLFLTFALELYLFNTMLYYITQMIKQFVCADV